MGSPLVLFLSLLILINYVNCERGERAAGDCKGGSSSGRYESNWNQDMSNAGKTFAVRDCFQQLFLKGGFGRWGCKSDWIGPCRCTVDSPHLFSWGKTFREAESNLEESTNGFLSKEAERFEGNLYLTYTCQ